MADVEAVPLDAGGVGSRGPASDDAICLFAFVACVGAREPPPFDEAPEQRPILHRVGAVTALIGVVPIADYCGADAERRLADVAWLAPRLRRHAELVAWAMRRSPVFPAPFATLYSSLASLTTFMRAHEATISSFLGAVADKEEWELRAVAEFERPDSLDQLACSAWPDWQELSKGARYMRLCRDRNALLEYGRAAAAARMRDFVAELAPLTADVRQHEALPKSGSGGTELIARYALLVAKSQVAAVHERVAEIAVRAARQHIAIASSGPWPPFSFRPDLESPR
ncbi:MAG: GvpL/GvpF family gas vesicle protein [Methylocystis sp.]|nr:GvpL/GvpF family gas vesicle protein [Methylocystis sp.]